MPFIQVFKDGKLKKAIRGKQAALSDLIKEALESEDTASDISLEEILMKVCQW
ncbi:MAG: hypothetical protein ABIA04_12485 [Pseudomonadota bacterium]